MSRRISQNSAVIQLDRYRFQNEDGRAKNRNDNRPLDRYSNFDMIDGRHSWQSIMPEGYVPYQVKQLEKGKVLYFNFALAREMGLLPDGHPDELTTELTAKIISTFSIQIINEYDVENGHVPPASQIKTHTHMATRYLQLQHANRQGKTSGDGRSVWNGMIRFANKTWDVSSRGTGVTCLAPGSVSAKKNLKTGDFEHGYGCGLADVSELYGSAVMSEIFHLTGIETERMLVIIDLGKGCGIGVRAAQNLIRPAHLFLYLKQNKYDSLKRATDYLILRQIENGAWNFSPTGPERYRMMLREVARAFGKFAANLERNYVFAWMDWDGDNVLATAGIIDYGSIRMFGLRHDQYRYDDVERFSTNLNEQRTKARLTVQVFAQLVDFLQSGMKPGSVAAPRVEGGSRVRRALQDFDAHPALTEFDDAFEREVRTLFLKQVGLSPKQSENLLKNHGKAVEKLYETYSVLEKTKTKAGAKKLPDGVNRAAVFNMRRTLRELPDLYFLGADADVAHLATSLRTSTQATRPLESIAPSEVLALMASSFSKKADLRLRGSLSTKITQFLQAYVRLMRAAAGINSGAEFKSSFALELKQNAQNNNRAGRITGNGSEFVVDAITRARKRGVESVDVQVAIDLFVASQVPQGLRPGHFTKPTSLRSNAGRLFQELVNIAHEFEEDI